ncbi:MAG: 16S rRNA (cytosine(1402)-N(4))-methyltransferase RsmH, partial [Actinomycetota bacterium]
MPSAEITGHHAPVLVDEVVRLLSPAPGDVVVDCTFGAGGHARRLASRIGPDGLYIAIDRDPSVREHFDAFAASAPCRTRFVRANFAEALPALMAEGVRADGVLMDLGVSSMQVDLPERGFSYARQAPLDMRMDPGEQRSAADLVADSSEAELAKVFRAFGEERHARPIARAIVRRRADSPITTTADLVEVIRGALPTPALFAGGHPAKRVFQALRIAVNDELGSLEAGLAAAFAITAPGGRLAVIAFHSLEDRMVKRFFVERSRGCVCPPELPACACGREPEGRLAASKALRPR